jgi:hypothetical protein
MINQPDFRFPLAVGVGAMLLAAIFLAYRTFASTSVRL